MNKMIVVPTKVFMELLNLEILRERKNSIFEMTLANIVTAGFADFISVRVCRSLRCKMCRVHCEVSVEHQSNHNNLALTHSN